MKASIIILGIVVVLMISAATVYAIPEGPASIIERSDSSRIVGVDNATGVQIQALAGNVSALFINSTKVTSRWQGYYGNVTGVITLDDAGNQTLYNWQLLNPTGEIYASNGSASGGITWSNVFCFNYTNNLSGGQSLVQRFNGTDVERMIGAASADVDSLNNTFNATFSGSFSVGGITIDSADGCRRTSLNVQDAYQADDFHEVLLTDNDSIIFTALLEQDATGFQGAAVDFQMLVGENGDVAGTSNYYFFVELA